MKYVLVVIISLSGLSVFTVPSGGVSISKILEGRLKCSLHNNLKSNSPTENNTNFFELIFSTDRPKTINLEIKQVKVNEQALYEGDGKKKEKTINERSYILIDQRFKVPMLHQLYSGQLPAQKSHIGTKTYKTFISNIDPDLNFFGTFQDIPDLSKAVTLKPYVDPYVKKAIRVSYYEPPKRINYNSEKKNAILDELNNLKIKVQAANKAIGHQYENKRKNNKIKDAFAKKKGVFNERLEYLELLKTPLIRTGAKTVNDRNDYMNKGGSTDDVDYDSKAPQGYNSKSLSAAYPTLTAPRETVKSTHYQSQLFPKEQPNFHASNIAWKVEEINMNSDSRLEDNVYRASEEDPEVFDKYIQIKTSAKATDEKRNINENTNSHQGKKQCLAPGCIVNQEKATSISHESKCKCDFHVEQYLKSDVNEIVEVGGVTVQKKPEKDMEDTIYTNV